MRRHACRTLVLLAASCGGDGSSTATTATAATSTVGTTDTPSDVTGDSGGITNEGTITTSASDSSGEASSTTAGDASTTTETSSTSSTGASQSFCECWDEFVSDSPNTCVLDPQPEQQCAVAADCCPATIPEDFTCLSDYPYLYECTDGQCLGASCESDQQCGAYAELVNATDFECTTNPWPCSDISYCTYTFAPTTCTNDDDCCVALPPYECGEDYPHLIDCVAGTCTSITCTSDAQCATYASESGLTNLGCSAAEAPECWNAPDAPEWSATPTCGYAKPCSVASDCCPDPMPAGYTCLDDFPYLYQCEDGQCSTAPCTNDNDCSTYAAALGTTATCTSPGG